MTLFSRKQQPEQPASDTTVPVVEPEPQPEPPQPQYLYTKSGERIVLNKQLNPVIMQISSGYNLNTLEVLTDSNGDSFQFIYALPARHHDYHHLLCYPLS